MDNSTTEALQRGHDVKFVEFVKSHIDLKTSAKPVNSHWMEYYKYCHSCIVQYDVIGKHNTLDRDVDYVLTILHLDDIIYFPLKPK